MLAGGALLGVWLAFQHVPEWYQPVEVPPAQLQAVRDNLVQTQNDFGERLAMSSAPFEVTISQEQVNAWLAAREDIWPLSREWLPPGVSEPFVRIEPGGIRVGATCQVGGVQSVVSALVAVAADDDSVDARVLQIRSGSLPLPENWLRDQLARIRPHGRLPREVGGLAVDPAGNSHAMASLADVLTGISIPNEAVWWEPKRPFRVVGLRTQSDTLVVTVKPLPYRHAR